MEFYVGQIIMFGGNFAIRSFNFCNGQLIAISQNNALYAILGTTYGGDGRTTFALPDLRGRVPINTGGQAGQGPGLSTYRLGQRGAAEKHTLNITEMPAHSHFANLTGEPSLGVSTGNGSSGPGQNTILAAQGTNTSTGASTALYRNNDTGTSPIGGVGRGSMEVQVGNSGGNQSFDIRQPYLAINFEIALYGIFPSRS